jgi:hypothetical protein
MRTAVLSAGVALVLLSQPAASQSLGTASVNAAVGQANAAVGAALGRANAALGALGINPGNPGAVSVGTGLSVPAAVAAPSGATALGGAAAPALRAAAAPVSGAVVGPGGATAGPSAAAVTGGTAPAPNIASSGAATTFVSASAAPLPAVLRPLQQGNERSTVYWSDMGVLAETRANTQALRASLRNRSGTSPSIVQSCRQAVAASAIPYGAVGLDTAAAGPVRSTPTGYRVTIAARLLYSRPGGSQVRQATFNCQLNRAGQVVAMR